MSVNSSYMHFSKKDLLMNFMQTLQTVGSDLGFGAIDLMK